ncbi:MAG TPA: hypothetical protein VI758_10385 [Bacteroidota bacterium]
MISRFACLFSLSLLCSIVLVGQVLSQGSGGNSSKLESVSVGLRFSHYGPKVDNINTAFANTEVTEGFPQGPQFDITYFASADVRYTIDVRHSVSVEGGLSLAKGTLQNSESFTRVYSVGLEYYYSLRNRKADFFGLDIGAGAGWLVANFERDYTDRRVSVLKKSLTGNVSLLGWMSPGGPIDVEVEARYMFVPNVAVDVPQATLKLSSLLFGAGIAIGL